jgi:ribosomal protein S18 acetylase RimI-like enzyme
MQIWFRRAKEADGAQIISMMQELYATDDLPFPARGPAALELLLREPGYGRCETIHDGDSTIGYFVVGYGFSLEFGGRDAFLDELYIKPDSRGKGVGRAAVERAAELCRELGIHALHLEVNSENTVAQRLYRRAGFTPRHSGYDLLTLRLE